MLLVNIMGNAFIITAYSINERHPKVFNHLNLRSLLTSKEMANNNDATYPSRENRNNFTHDHQVQVTIFYLNCLLQLQELQISAAAAFALSGVTAGVLVAVTGFAGAEFNGAPTEISQRWPG